MKNYIDKPGFKDHNLKGVKNYYAMVKESTKKYLSTIVEKNEDTPELYVSFYKREEIFPKKLEPVGYLKALFNFECFFFLGLLICLIGLIKVSFFSLSEDDLGISLIAFLVLLGAGGGSILAFFEFIYRWVMVARTGYSVDIFNNILKTKTHFVILTKKSIYVCRYRNKQEDGIDHIQYVDHFEYNKYDFKDIKSINKIIENNGEPLIEVVMNNDIKLCRLSKYNEKEGFDLLNEMQSRLDYVRNQNKEV